jgi:hypothetical protein
MVRIRHVESSGTSLIVAADGGGGNGKRKEGRRKWVIGMGRCLRVVEHGSWMIPSLFLVWIRVSVHVVDLSM